MKSRTAAPNQVLSIVCAGIILANLDLFIVNVALPDIARSFPRASLQDLSWVLNGYAITYAALLVFFGRLSERYYRNHSFMLGVSLFTVASAACAMANSVWSLVGFRVIQAAGAALMTPTSLGLLLASFPPEGRAGAVRTWTAIGGLGAALGPMVGGLLVTIDWRWIFIVNLPIGLGALLASWRLLPDVPGHDVKRPSILAAALVTAGIASVTYAIIKVNDWGWYSPQFGGWLLVAMVLLCLFILHCIVSANPFVDPNLFRIRSFTGAVIVTVPFSAAFGGMLLSIALFEQKVWGFSAMRTGLTITPGPLMVPLTSLLVAGRLIGRLGPATVIAGGLLCFAAGVVCWAVMLTNVPDIIAVMFGMVLTGIGVGLTVPTLMGVGLGSLPPASFATGSGVINMFRQAFMAIGVAVLVAIVGTPATFGASVGAFRRVWYVLAVMTLAGLVPTARRLRMTVRRQ